MSEINSKAVATIEVNGKQVEQELAKLKKRAEVLASRGYTIRYVGVTDRHGWAMRLLV